MQKGSITKRADGRYMGRYYDQGKQKSVYSKNKKDCAIKLKQAIKEAESDNKKIDKNMKLNDWFNFYVEMFKKPVSKDSTLKILHSNYNANIKNAIGLMPIAKITPKIAKEFIDNLENNNRKKVSYNLLTDLYDKLMDYQLVKFNVMKLFALSLGDESTVKKGDERTLFLSDEEIYKIFTYMKNGKRGRSKFLDIAEFMLYTGIRIGEAVALTWNDIDVENKSITINKSYSSISKKVTTTKTVSGIRTIPLFENAEKVLNRLPKGKSNEVIFNIDSSSFSSNFSFICRSLKIKASVHSLRHTFSSRCYEMKIEPKVVQSWLGHKSVNTTLDTYTEISKEKEKEQTKLINNYTLNIT